MKIAIDARLYGLEHAGPGRYVQNLVDELVKLDKENSYEILLRDKYFQILDLPNNWTKHRAEARHYSLKEQIVVLNILNKLSPDITHFPHFNVPITYNKPFVVTIHDLSKHRSKGREATTLPYWQYLIKRMGYHTVFSHAISKSKHIIVPTNFVKEDVVNIYKISPHKITVTYEGISLKPTTIIRKDLSRKYNIEKPYFLFIGSAYPHKNLDRLVEAVVYLNELLEVNAQLAISSSRSIFTERLNSLITAYGAENYVKLVGFVPDDELSWLFKNSVGLVYPTLMEGFGLPGLEAMVSGTLVLASDIPVLREVYEEHALYFNPYDFTAIGRAMRDALTMNDNKRKKMIYSAQKFVSKYSWEAMAKQTLQVYEDSVSLR